MGESSIAYLVLIGVFTVIGGIVSTKLRSKFNKYNRMRLSSNLSGAEVAMKMLADYGLTDIKIVPGRGMLTDHYNPKTKTISLSEVVYSSRSIGAAAVAAHETGHAIQHATSYNLLALRSNLVPIVQFFSKAQMFLFIIFLFGLSSAFGGLLLGILVVSFALTALFSFVTLPVEFDASKRALAWLEESGITQGVEHDGAKDALWWAAMTYVSKALASLVIFLFFLAQFLNNKNNR